jgi:hypothetical protein
MSRVPAGGGQRAAGRLAPEPGDEGVDGRARRSKIIIVLALAGDLDMSIASRSVAGAVTSAIEAQSQLRRWSDSFEEISVGRCAIFVDADYLIAEGAKHAIAPSRAQGVAACP